jgi:hypothetical protein
MLRGALQRLLTLSVLSFGGHVERRLSVFVCGILCSVFQTERRYVILTECAGGVQRRAAVPHLLVGIRLRLEQEGCDRRVAALRRTKERRHQIERAARKVGALRPPL